MSRGAKGGECGAKAPRTVAVGRTGAIARESRHTLLWLKALAWDNPLYGRTQASSNGTKLRGWRAWNARAMDEGGAMASREKEEEGDRVAAIYLFSADVIETASCRFFTYKMMEMGLTIMASSDLFPYRIVRIKYSNSVCKSAS